MDGTCRVWDVQVPEHDGVVLETTNSRGGRTPRATEGGGGGGGGEENGGGGGGGGGGQSREGVLPLDNKVGGCHCGNGVHTYNTHVHTDTYIHTHSHTQLYALMWSPNGRQLAVGRGDGAALVWYCNTKALQHHIHEDVVVCGAGGGGAVHDDDGGSGAQENKGYVNDDDDGGD